MNKINETKAYLLSVPLENDYKHTLYFNNAEEQENYFKGRKVAQYDDFNFQRKDEPIRVPEIDSMGLVTDYAYLINSGVNYVMYKNAAHENKWIYAFITDIRYISEGVVEIEIETDVIQTYFFKYTVKPSFVEREHVSDDTVGKHTIEEGLETGEYVTNKHSSDDNLNKLHIVWGTTVNSNGNNVQGNLYNGVYSGLKYYSLAQADFESVNSVLKLYDNMGKADAIQCIFMAPKFLIEDEDGTAGVQGTNTEKSYIKTFYKSYDLDGYSPHNNKLKCFPFNYLMVSNNNGNAAVYPYEYFDEKEGEGQVYFEVAGALTPGCSIRAIPMYYKGVDKNHEEGLNLGKYPICNWNSDVYINWLTQNSINVGGVQIDSDQMAIGSAAMGSLMQIMGGMGLMATGSGAIAGGSMIASGIGGGITGISNAVMQQKQHQMMPPQAKGNTNCGDVITAQKANTFHFYEMSIKQEFAMIIDRYFDMFGYKVNMIKRPNKCHRSRYWYTKTIDVNIDGKIPNKDIQIIKNCYNNGITFWRNPDEIQKYNLDNEIAFTDGAIKDDDRG